MKGKDAPKHVANLSHRTVLLGGAKAAAWKEEADEPS
jgi:hypothetical protein